MIVTGKAFPPNRPILLLGIGAQKSGTTWLFNQLRFHPEVGFGGRKEKHLWASLWDKNLSSRKPKRISSRIRRAVYVSPNGSKIPFHPLFKGWLARDYFVAAQEETTQGKRVVADISPTYAAMTSKGFYTVRRFSLKHGFEPRVLFILREPVARVVSGILHANRSLKNPTNDELIQIVRDSFKTYPVAIRTRYDKTIDHLEKVFGPDDVKYLFFENLFTKSSITSLSDWLGIAPISAEFTKAVGEAKRRIDLPEELSNEIRAYYAPVYSFCLEKFGEDIVPQEWKASYPLMDTSPTKNLY